MTQTHKRLIAGLRGVAFLVVVLLSFRPVTETNAHSLDMYAQAQTIQITRDGLQIDWTITPGPMLAAFDWGQTDQNQDGKISQEEARAWLAPFLSQLVIS